MIERYQKLKEGIYEICKRRKLKLDELAFSIYLRGKSQHYGNPFYLTNKTIYMELNTTREIIDKIKARLQLKGVIKYDAGIGRNYTTYYMLDTFESVSKDTVRVREKRLSIYKTKDKKRKSIKKLAHFLLNNRMMIRSL